MNSETTYRPNLPVCLPLFPLVCPRCLTHDGDDDVDDDDDDNDDDDDDDDDDDAGH